MDEVQHEKLEPHEHVWRSPSVACIRTANMNIKPVTLVHMQHFTQYNAVPHFWPQREELSKSHNTQGDMNNKMIISSTLHIQNHECTCGNLYHAACSYLSKSTLCNYCAIKPLRQCNDWLRCWHGAGSVTQSPRLILHSKLQCFPHHPSLTLKQIFWFWKGEETKSKHFFTSNSTRTIMD